jgi:hypothetical protein
MIGSGLARGLIRVLLSQSLFLFLYKYVRIEDKWICLRGGAGPLAMQTTA